MDSLLHLHIITFIVVFMNFMIFNKNTTTDLGSKYFFINYIYHNHKKLSFFLSSYPFFIILIYFLAEKIVPVGTLFVAILHLYFLHEIISQKNIVKREEYIYWYKQNVKHSFSMHAYDMLKKDFRFLNQKINRLILFKFELIFFVCLVIESEVIYEIIFYWSSTK